MSFDEHDAPPPDPQPGTPRQHRLQFQPLSARLPEHLRQGVFSTGAIVLQGPDEFVIDFLLRLTQPSLVTARIVLAPSVMGRFVAALGENLGQYQRTFGALPQAPQPLAPTEAAAPPRTIEELYDQLKLPDEVLGGVYANAVMIGHTATEFSFDFITNFYPRSAVAARVFMASGQVPGLLDALARCWQRRDDRGPAPGGEAQPPAE